MLPTITQTCDLEAFCFPFSADYAVTKEDTEEQIIDIKCLWRGARYNLLALAGRACVSRLGIRCIVGVHQFQLSPRWP